MNYAKHVIEKALNLGQAFIAFYCTSEATLREIGKNLKTRTVRPNILELERSAELNRRQEKHHTLFLGDNFDTPPALLELQSLIRSTNVYIGSQGEASSGLLDGMCQRCFG